MLNRTENGLRATNPEEVASILGAYGVTGADRERLLALARDAERPGWWEPGDSIYPAALKALIGFETQATRITDVETSLVPGLLQTAEYTRAVMQACGVPPLEVETRVATRLGRQAILSRPAPPMFSAFIDEASLRRPVGGARAMAEQLHHIRRAASRPNISVRIIPLHTGAHAALSGPFTILEFERAKPLVHQEGKSTLCFVDSSAEVKTFVTCVDTLKSTSLTPERSIEYLDSIIADHGRQEPA